MTNPWTQQDRSSHLPAGCAPDAIANVRAAYGLKAFEMTRRLGITVSELTACETESRWPHGDNARRKLVEMAREKGLVIAPPELYPASDAEPSLF